MFLGDSIPIILLFQNVVWRTFEVRCVAECLRFRVNEILIVSDISSTSSTSLRSKTEDDFRVVRMSSLNNKDVSMGL